ncbi:MAG: CehA/McbA family metallohydrolase, partial [Acetivibrio ethanolgignens]
MKRLTRRCTAILLCIAMLLGMLPANIFAEEQTGRYSKITDISELSTGKYLLVSDKGYAAGTLDKDWITAEAVTESNGYIENPNPKLIWMVTASGSSITLQDANGEYIKPKGGDTSGIAKGEYFWDVVAVGGKYNIKGTGEDKTTLAGATKSGNKFKSYKNKTVNGPSYAKDFTLYRFVEGSITPSTQVVMPKAEPGSGRVTQGTRIELTCATSNAVIYYNTESAEAAENSWKEYGDGDFITINKDTTIYAKAVMKDKSLTDSEVTEFSYTLPTPPAAVGEEADPIKEIPAGALSITDALKKSKGETVTVVGQLVYRFGKNDTTNSAILQDVIDGQIVGLQVYNSLDGCNIGDVLKVTGKRDEFGKVPQIGGEVTKEILIPAKEAKKIPVQEFDTIDDLLSSRNDLLSEWIKLKNVTLGKLVKSSNTVITDSKGATINIYTAALFPYEVEKGEKVDLYACFSRNKDAFQLRVGSYRDYVVINDNKAPLVTLPERASAEIGKAYKVVATVQDNVGAVDVQMSYSIGEEPKKLAMEQNKESETLWEAVIPADEFKEGISEALVSVVARDAKGNTSEEATMTLSVKDEPQIEKVTPKRNAVVDHDKRPSIIVACTNVGDTPQALLTLSKGEATVLDKKAMTYKDGSFFYQPDKDLEDGKYTAVVVVSRKDGKTAAYEWSFTIGKPSYKLYFGQLHSHTGEYSDGSGQLSEALEYVKAIPEKDNIDFVAFTDHSNYFDEKNAANPAEALYNPEQMTASSRAKWNTYKSTVADFNKSQDKIVALAGFEMTWSGGPGHINTFNTPGLVSRNNGVLNNKADNAGLKAYYTLLKNEALVDSISQLNHPGTTFGTFADFGYWDTVIDSRVNMVEVGNGEGAIGSGGYFPSYTYYTMALDKGWHVAPTNNQDNHKGRWGNANDARDVIIADSLAEEEIYQAMRERRMYATEDKNLEIMYTVNDQMMGSSLTEVPESLTVKISLNDPDDTIQKAELIANSGRVVHKWDVNAQNKELTAIIDPDYSYYYLRVTEADGDLAVTAPVWVGKMRMLGVSNLECNTDTPVTEEVLTLTTTLFNSEKTDARINSLTYKQDGAVISKGKPDSDIIRAGSELRHEIGYTPKQAKLTAISVEAEIEQDGKVFTYKKEIKLNIRDIHKMVYVGIDGSHQNEYVSGNYKDSMTNFTKLAGGYNVRCVILRTKEEFLAAAGNKNGKYRMLVLTAPSRRDGTSLRNPYDNYSIEELKAIKGFSEAGGTLVVGNWSDYYENYGAFAAEDHMAAQQNKVLETIGSRLRVSDDGTNDDKLNGGQKQRLYLSTYNLNNFLMKGVIYDAEHPNDNKYSQLFSQYGGSSIYAVDEKGKAINTLPDSVSPMVYGHATTYSVDSDKDGLGEKNVPKYAYAPGDDRLLLLASETITHANGNQSMVLVGGAAFMSNFE